MVTVHRFSSISERRAKRIPRPLHSLLIYFFLRECEVELGEEEEERGGLDKEWGRKVEEEIWGWMNWNENETVQKWLKLASWTQPLTWHCWIYRIPSNVVYLMRPYSVWRDYSEGKYCLSSSAPGRTIDQGWSHWIPQNCRGAIIMIYTIL